MKFNQLRDFVAVAEQGSIRGAARVMNLAQPAMTRSIQELEYSLGVKLFIREGRGVTLTSAGKDLLSRATLILNEIRKAKEGMTQFSGHEEGSITIGMSIVGHLAIMVNTLDHFKKRYPKVKVKLIEGFLPTLENDLKTGGIDFYIGPFPQNYKDQELISEKLFDNERVILCRKGHPLENVKSISDLVDAHWLTTSITYDAMDELEYVFTSNNLPKPILSFQCQSALSILTVLSTTDSLAMMPIQWCQSDLTQHLLSHIRVNERFAAPPIHVIRRAGLGLTPAGEYLLHLMKLESEEVSIKVSNFHQ
jgi:LysR family transcriptional regulator of abg operon